MRIFIPAAGNGTRLKPLTDLRPKCMVEINGAPILFHLLTQLKELPVSEIVIVTGYRGDLIQEFVAKLENYPKIRLIHNEKFATTNSIVSVALMREFWDQDFCIIDGDLLLKNELLYKLITTDGSFLMIDNSKEQEEIDMKAKVENGNLSYMDKLLQEDETFGEFFGLSKWKPETACFFSNAIDAFLEANRTDVWYEFAIREIPKQINVPVVTCMNTEWFEIDTIADYEKAQSFFL